MDAIKHDCFTTHLSTKQRCQVNTIGIRAAGQKRDLRTRVGKVAERRATLRCPRRVYREGEAV